MILNQFSVMQGPFNFIIELAIWSVVMLGIYLQLRNLLPAFVLSEIYLFSLFERMVGGERLRRHVTAVHPSPPFCPESTHC